MKNERRRCDWRERSLQTSRSTTRQKIIQGIEHDNAVRRRSGEIEEGRELFKSRVSAEIFTSSNFFERAIVDIVIKPKGHMKSKIW
jgi:hypothetical protein